MLDVEIERAVGVVFERIAVADREAVDGVGDLETFSVVHRQRPERADGRKLRLVEMHDIVIFRRDRLAVGVGDVQRIDRVLRLVGAEADCATTARLK